jgi:hypothetical protein
LLGDHVQARTTLKDATERCATANDALGRAQCFILLALLESALGQAQKSRELLMQARSEFDGIGYRLGIAQCDVALGHADHRAYEFGRARARSLAARAAFRELSNPRGEAACERLLAMIALDTDDYAAASAHAQVALKIYCKLQDPWGELEARLLLAQVALARGDEDAIKLVHDCERITLDEAEPRQHRHLTQAWLAQSQARWSDAATDIDRARTAFGDRVRTGDHTPHLLLRFSKLMWLGPALSKIDAWMQALERIAEGGPPSSQEPRSLRVT